MGSRQQAKYDSGYYYYNHDCYHCHTLTDIQSSMPSYAPDSFVSASSRAFNQQSGCVRQMSNPSCNNNADFDILEWHPAYQSCQKYFLDHAQHEPGTQALCALINIRLPFQWSSNPVFSSDPSSQNPNQPGQSPFNFNAFSRQAQSPPHRNGHPQPPVFVSLVPYVRRLVITGFDKGGILHGLFGDAWQGGITPLQDCERRNYLFAAKHGGWRSCKKQYDLNEEETVPFLKPLENVRPDELDAADKSWGEWLAMEDWMLGPRAPDDQDNGTKPGMSSGARYRADLPDGV